MWERMQLEAEEKKKGYCCLVYSTAPVTRAMLEVLEGASNRDRDDDGTPCLKVQQKTPLRVMHRRSLLDRDKIIYEIVATPLNAHYFLLRLITSAGAYVKEFVHGDFGRTVPSVKSILGCCVSRILIIVLLFY